MDFCCLSLKLIVELDGAGHGYESRAKRDRQRDPELERRRYQSTAIPEWDGPEGTDGVCEKLQECVAELEQIRLKELRR